MGLSFSATKTRPFMKGDDYMKKDNIIRNVIIAVVAAIAGLIIWAAFKAFRKE